ncbi:MAG: hypothetical protein Q4A37_01220 [Candidatus Saccharibacteria bacterium]|nr:hypothetical protein [Candidatus Saccharibacteria bacterium]
MKITLPFSKKTPPSSDSEVFVSRRRAQVLAQKEATPLDDGAYRRHRTLNTRHSSSPAETSARLLSHMTTQRRTKLLRAAAITIAILIAATALLTQIAGTITVQTPDAASAKHTDRYTAILQRYYTGRPSERFLPLLQANELKSFFLEHAPEVKTIRVESRGVLAARLKLTFRQPLAQWSSGQHTYFVDDDGVTFERNYFATPSVIVKDQSGIPASAGQEVINRQFLGFLGQAVAQLQQRHMKVTEAVLPPHTVRQLELKVEGLPYAIKMTAERGAKAQVKQAMRAIAFLKKHQRTPSYIDVRVDQRVFYQ